MPGIPMMQSVRSASLAHSRITGLSAAGAPAGNGKGLDMERAGNTTGLNTLQDDMRE